MGEVEIRDFLSHLAADRNVAASTQNQGLNALVFIYKNVLGRPAGDLTGIERASRPAKLPVVLSEREVRALLAELDGTMRCMALLLYGAGLRILECARLRIKDVDFHQRIMTLQETSRGDWREPRQTARSAARRANLAMGCEGVNGGRGRVTMLPEAARDALSEQIKFARAFYDADRAAGVPGVHLPNAMVVKIPAAATSWPWFWC